MSKRDEYVMKLKAKLDEWNAAIDELEAKAQKAEAQKRQEHMDKVQELKRKRDEASYHLHELSTASDDAWESMKSGAEDIWFRFTKTLKETKDAFQDGMREK